MKFLPSPPFKLLIDSVTRVLRAGVPEIPVWTPANAWSAGQPCPAGHPIFPAGFRIYDYLTDTGVDAPLAEVLCDDEAVPTLTYGQLLWKISLEITLLWDTDIWESEAGINLQAALKMLLTNAMILPGGAVQTAQQRLSTSTLHIAGSRDADNFLNQQFTKLTEVFKHPSVSFNMDVICAGIYVP
jgi:hypothetical protein